MLQAMLQAMFRKPVNNRNLPAGHKTGCMQASKLRALLQWIFRIQTFRYKKSV